VLDQVDDDRIESLLATVFQILLGFLPGEAGDERPWRVAMDQERRAALIHHVATIGAYANGIGTSRKCDNDARQRGA
jgi:hypothetical protein